MALTDYKIKNNYVSETLAQTPNVVLTVDQNGAIVSSGLSITSISGGTGDITKVEVANISAYLNNRIDSANSNIASISGVNFTQQTQLNGLISLSGSWATITLVSGTSGVLQSNITSLTTNLDNFKTQVVGTTAELNSRIGTIENNYITVSAVRGLTGQLATTTLLAGTSGVLQSNINAKVSADILRVEVSSISSSLQNNIDNFKTQVVGTTGNLQTQINSKISDAPSDGNQYARQNATWVIVTGVTGTGSSGSGFLPLAGIGLTITPSGSNYVFTVSDYISKTEVASLSSNLQIQINNVNTGVNNVTGQFATKTLVAGTSGVLQSNINSKVSADILRTEVASISSSLQNQINNVNTGVNNVTGQFATITLVAGTSGVLQSNINSKVSADILRTEVASISSSLQNQINNVNTGVNNVTGQFATTTLVAGTSGVLQSSINLKLSDAPSDGNQYARQNGAWTIVTTTSGSQSSGAGFTPLSGIGMTITPSGSNYSFAVNDYISKTEVNTITGQLVKKSGDTITGDVHITSNRAGSSSITGALTIPNGGMAVGGSIYAGGEIAGTTTVGVANSNGQSYLRVDVTNPEVNLRSNQAGSNSSYVRWTQDNIADRWYNGIVGSNTELYWSAGSPYTTGSYQMKLTTAGDLTISNDLVVLGTINGYVQTSTLNSITGQFATKTLVAGTSGVLQSNINSKVSADILRTEVASISSSLQNQINNVNTSVNNVTGQFSTITLVAGTSGVLQSNINAKLSDAPSDGNQYARQNGAWAIVTTTSGSSSSGAGFTPLAGIGMSITPSGSNYAFAVKDSIRVRQIGFRTELSGGVVSNGPKKIYVKSPFNGTITGWTMITDIPTISTLDVWKANGVLPNLGNTITTSGSKPSLASSTLASSVNVSAWNTLINTGDILELNVDSNSSASVINLTLDVIVS